MSNVSSKKRFDDRNAIAGQNDYKNSLPDKFNTTAFIVDYSEVLVSEASVVGLLICGIV